MQKSMLFLFIFVFSFSLFAQQAEIAPYQKSSANAIYKEAIWDLQINNVVGVGGPIQTNGNAGITYLNGKYYISKWSSPKIYVLNSNYQLEDSISISSLTTGFRALTTDGTYLYASTATNNIYKIDLSTKTLAQTLTGAAVTVRFLTYDPTADNGNGGFWIGNYSTNITLVKKDTVSKKIFEITAASHGLTAMYGAAIDVTTPGGPYLYIANQKQSGVAQEIVKFKASNGQKLETYNVLTDFGTTNPNAIMGGLFVQKNLIGNTTTLLGVLQGTPDILFGYLIDEPIVGPGYATNFYPANGGMNIPLNVQLKWSNPSGTNKVAVYLSDIKDRVTYRYSSALVLSNVLDSVFIPSNLQYNKEYYWRVLTIASNNDTTLGPVLKFKTEYGVVTSFPYTEDFEGTVFPPDGWLNPQGFWGIGKKGTSGTGAYSGNQSARVAYNHATNPAELISPKFAIPSMSGGGNPYKISFWWKDNDIPTSIAGHDTTYFEISTNNGQTWQVLGQLAAAAKMDNWENFSILLNSYAGQTVIFKWRDVTNKSFSAYGTGLDLVKIEEVTPLPNKVVYVSPADKDTMQVKNVDLVWKSGMGAAETGFKIYFSTDSNEVKSKVATALVKDTVLSSAPTSSQLFVYKLTNLNWDTKYYYQVVAYNNSGTADGGLRMFKTVKNPTVTTFPYVEDFELGMLPPGWQKGPNSNWKVAVKSGLAPKSGNYALGIKYNGFSGSTILSPNIQLPSNKDMRIKFWWINNDYTLTTSENSIVRNYTNGNSTIEKLNYQISRNFKEIVNADTTFFEISTNAGNSWDVLGFLSAPAKQTEWEEFTAELSAYKGKEIQLRYRFVTNGSLSAYGAGVDLITIEEIPVGIPYTPVVVEPQNNAKDLPKDVVVRWERGNGPIEDQYKLYFGQDSTSAQVYKTYNAAKEVVDTLKNLEYGKSYFWAVEAINSYGSMKTSYYKFTVMNDPTIKNFPYVENFDNTPVNTIPKGWTTIDANNDGKVPYVYQTNGWAYSQPNVLVQEANATKSMDDWAILPQMQLKSGLTYKLKIKYTVGDSTLAEKFEVKYGNDKTIAALNNTIIPVITTKSWDWAEAVGTFTPTANGIYYIGIHTLSTAASSAIIFDDVEVSVALDKDIAIKGIIQPAASVPNEGVIPIVKIINNGLQTASNFSVTLKIGNEYNETKNVTTLGANTTLDVVFPKWSPSASQVYNVVAYVNWQDDMYKQNDTLKNVTKVLPFATAFNFNWANDGLKALYGAEFGNGKFYASVWNSTTGRIYVYNKDKELIDSMDIQGYSGASGLRDLTWDGKYLYGGNNATSIYKIDPTTKSVVSTITFTGTGNVRGIAYNAKQDAFYVGGYNPGATNILLVNRNGAIIKTIPNTLATYSIAYDTISPNGPFLWVATNTVFSGTTALDYKLFKLNANTGAIVDSLDIIGIAEGTTPGGLFITHEFFNDGSMVLGGLSQGGNFWGIRFKDYIVGNENYSMLPKEFALSQNYPNPFNPTTNIRFSLPVASKISLKVYNMLGQEVASIFNGELSAGMYNMPFNASMLSSGVYVYKLEAKGVNGSNFNQVKKMILMK